MLYIAADHAGYQMKKNLIKYLKTQLEIDAVDLGPESYEENDDYPDYAFTLAEKVASEKGSKGILVCGTGQGVCIAANKVPGIRAIIGYSIEGAETGRRHNDANVLCLAGRVLSDDHAAAIAKKFLETDFSAEERHLRRIKKIEVYTK